MVVTHSTSHCTFHSGLHLTSHCIPYHAPFHINHIILHNTTSDVTIIYHMLPITSHSILHTISLHHITSSHIAHRCCIPLHVMWPWCVSMWLWCAMLCIVAKIGAWCGMVWYEMCDVECVSKLCMIWDVVHFLPPHHTTTYCTSLLHTSAGNAAVMYNYVAVMCNMWCIVAKIGVWCVMWWWQMWCGMVWCDVECVGTVCMMWDVVHFLPPPHNTTYCTPLLHTSTCNVAMMYNYVAVMCSMWCIVAKIGAWCVIWWWQMWCEMVWYEMCDVECVGTVCMMWDGTKRNVVWWDVKYGSITLHISSHNTHSTCTIPHHTNPFHISPPQLIYHTFHQIPHHTFHTTTVLCDEMWNVLPPCGSGMCL